jgi:hypothetical protein
MKVETVRESLSLARAQLDASDPVVRSIDEMLGDTRWHGDSVGAAESIEGMIDKARGEHTQRLPVVTPPVHTTATKPAKRGSNDALTPAAAAAVGYLQNAMHACERGDI